MIVIIDYKTANLGSIINLFKRIGVAARVAEKPKDIQDATHILLPGIGHFDTCARNLRQLGFADVLESMVKEKQVPLLGICVGAQLLTKGSEEGNESGLGWIDAVTRRFPLIDSPNYKVPHMGWNVAVPPCPHPLFTGFETPPRFYFVHSYFMQCDRSESVLSLTTHGLEFASGIVKDNIAGVQFHPEKSHRFGMQLLKNFATFTLPSGSP
jgi:glutamine amidotransferase